MILYPKEAASRGVVMPGQFSVGYCGTTQYYDHGRRNYTVPLEIGSNEFLKVRYFPNLINSLFSV